MDMTWTALAGIVGLIALFLAFWGFYLRLNKALQEMVDALGKRVEQRLDRLSARLDAMSEAISGLRTDTATLSASTVRVTECRDRHAGASK